MLKKRERSGSGLVMNDPFLLDERLGHADSVLSSAFSRVITFESDISIICCAWHRYMEPNKEITRTYREEVKKLKERRAKLKGSLEK